MEADEEFSGRLSTALDKMGYSMAQICWRRKAYKQKDLVVQDKCPDSAVYTVGSKGEGVSKYFESDHDVLYVKKTAVCVEMTDGADDGGDSADRNATRSICSPGYALVHTWQGKRISSEQFLAEKSAHVRAVNMEGFDTPRQSGPAQTLSVRRFNMDVVYGYRCRCPTVLEAWAVRPRKHNWPPKYIIDEISKMDAFIVAKGSENEALRQFEWRLCFNLAENRLIQSLDETQTKLYVLLKIVLKDILKPTNKEITSFIIKNLIFWLFERRNCKGHCLFGLLTKALRILKKAVGNNFLSYYMIPARNLMSGKMTTEQRKTMSERLTMCLNEGHGFLNRSEKLVVYLDIDFGNLDKHGDSDFKDGVERLHIDLCIQTLELEKPEEIQTNPITRKLTEALYDRVYPGWKFCKKREFNFKDIIMERLEQMLS